MQYIYEYHVLFEQYFLVCLNPDKHVHLYMH